MHKTAKELAVIHPSSFGAIKCYDSLNESYDWMLFNEDYPGKKVGNNQIDNPVIWRGVYGSSSKWFWTWGYKSYWTNGENYDYDFTPLFSHKEKIEEMKQKKFVRAVLDIEIEIKPEYEDFHFSGSSDLSVTYDLRDKLNKLAEKDELSFTTANIKNVEWLTYVANPKVTYYEINNMDKALHPKLRETK